PFPDNVQRLAVVSANDRDYYFGPSQRGDNVTSLYEVNNLGNAHAAFEPKVPEDGYTTSFGLASSKDTVIFSSYVVGMGVEIIQTAFTQSCLTVLDIRRGPETSIPTHFLVHGDMLFFAADDGKSGNELWRYKPVEPMTCTPTFLPIVKVQ
ncbi:MAG: hypothetical protein KDE46_29845, partial [Caldilineaceae bacterium]|nr:hypothetical protein [Caldilineaceae bacterium]